MVRQPVVAAIVDQLTFVATVIETGTHPYSLAHTGTQSVTGCRPLRSRNLPSLKRQKPEAAMLYLADHVDPARLPANDASGY